MTAAGARYIVGIDLGTTNSALAYVDQRADEPAVQIFPIPQFTAAATIEARDTLPSCSYELTAGEMAGAALAAPWRDEQNARYIVGSWALDLGAEAPARLVASAKSWLCHPGIDRTAPILPWRAAEGVARISPIVASARFLDHLRRTWNEAHPGDPLERQRVIVTIPASFDEMARELTLRAARAAELEEVLLIEEPVAAFCSWSRKHAARAEAAPQPGSIILVCDVGGGTTDFTLIHVRATEAGAPDYHRVAVGEHLILGGDNLDLALAYHVEKKLAASTPLTPHLWMWLVRRCRRAKELLLGEDAPAAYTIHLPSGGSSLFRGSIQTELTRAEVLEVLVDGFLPRVPSSALPTREKSGFREFGLPYAPDPGITRYLAEFLAMSADAGTLPTAKTISGFVRPDYVLLNGGFFASPVLRARLLEVLQSWYAPAGGGDRQVRVLENDRLDLAVADGAAWYGLARHLGRSVVHTGASRAYYIGLSSGPAAVPSAVCLIPGGLPEGTEVRMPDRKFELLVHQPAEFPIFSSAYRAHDKPGDLVVPSEALHFTELPPLRTILKARDRKSAGGHVQVTLNARLTEVGTIELWCSEIGGKRTWRLQFESRRQAPQPAAQADSAPQPQPQPAGRAEDTTAARLHRVDPVLQAVFGMTDKIRHPPALMKELEKAVGLARDEWPLPILRGVWDKLREWEEKRWLSDQHHARWLNAAGYCLRPGYGMTLDDWRMQESSALVQEDDLTRDDTPDPQAEWFLYWRRTSGGLNAGRQSALARFAAQLIEAFPPDQSKRAPSGREYQELWRMLGSLEWLDAKRKIALGDLALAALARHGSDACGGSLLFAVSRFGARVPAYGPINTVLPPETVEAWIDRLLGLGASSRNFCVALMLLARRTDDRFRDVSGDCRHAVTQALTRANASAHVLQVVNEVVELAEEQTYVFGERLPIGLRLV